MPWKKSLPIELTDEEKHKLESAIRKAKTSQQEVFRAKIILQAAHGLGNKTIARILQTTPLTVRYWRKRFFQQRLQGLQDKPRSGRPCVFSP